MPHAKAGRWRFTVPAYFSGEVGLLDDGASPITEIGLKWSTTPNPTPENNQGMQVHEDNWFEEFFFNLFNLTPGQTYFMRAFGVNSHGMGYSNQISFTTVG